MKKYLTALMAVGLTASILAGCVNTVGDIGATKHPPVTESTGATVPSSSATEPSTGATDPTVPSAEETLPSQGSQATVPSAEVTEPTAPSTEPTDPPEVPTEPSAPATETTSPAVPTVPAVPGGKPGQLQGIYSRGELEGMNTTVNGWGLGPYTDDDNRPIDSVRAQDKYGKYEAYYIAPNDGKIYLTFDEGYENGYTAQILDVLKEKNVKAVFFITMQYAKSDPELVQRMIDEGHVVGNHSVKHKSMPTLSIDRMIEEVVGLHDYMLEHFGYEMTLFRPPMGEFSQQSLAVLQELGYKSVMWSFAHYDYDPENQPSHDKTYRKITEAAHSGAIYLLHAVSEANTAVLGDVIDYFRQQGFEMALFQ